MCKGDVYMDLYSEINITEPIRFALKKLDRYSLRLKLERDRSCTTQGYRRQTSEKGVTLKAADDAGFMYGLLDVADCLRKGEPVGEAEGSPYLLNRGIKFNIPLDARTPSYSDAATSATKNIVHMWEKSFWHEFLDRMAEEKYNVLSLWSLSPFPSLVRIPEFPKACIDDVKVSARPYKAELSGKGNYGEDHRKNLYTVKKIGIDEKIRFWREIMEYAASRCIKIYLFTWNLFVYGTEDSGYELTDDLENPLTRKYVYSGIKALLETYPLLAGIGVTSGENMTYNGRAADASVPFSQTDIGFVYETYAKAIADYLKEHQGREFTLIHRMQMARYDEIMAAYEGYPGKFEISFKYSQAHMYSSTKPAFIQNFLKELKDQTQVWLTVRNDDYYMYRWGDPVYGKEYLSNMPVDRMAGFYMGADGFTWGRDYMSRYGLDASVKDPPQFIDKMWYMFKIWGQLSYNIKLDESYFASELQQRFHLNKPQAMILYEAWKEASQIIPEFNCIHWHDFDFQWYPEGCCMYEPRPMDKVCFANIHEFMSCPAMPGAGYLSASEYAQNLASGEEYKNFSPETIADSIETHALRACRLLNKLKSEITIDDTSELSRTVNDIEAMSQLGRYYSKKEKAAIQLCLYKITHKKEYQKCAVAFLQEASGYWKTYSKMTTSSYVPQVLTRLLGKIDVRDFDEAADLDICLAMEEYG